MSLLELKLQILLKSAEIGDAQAQLDLGLLLLETAHSQEDINQAVLWLHRAAKREHPQALYELARLYLTGKAGSSDSDPLNRALKWLLKAKELGHPEAGKYFQTVMATLQAHHPDEYDPEYNAIFAEEEYGEENAEDYGSTEDYDDYASSGGNGPQTHANDTAEVTPAANTSDSDRAEDEEPDPDSVFVDDAMLSKRSSLQTLAEMGNTQAMAILGEFWLLGQDGPKDEQKAMEWLQKAADKDEPTALFRLGSICLHGSETELQDFAKARQFLFRAVALGSSQALFTLGELYAHGQNKSQDYRKAAQYFEKALQAGILPAYARLAQLYSNGLGVAQDDAKALELYAQGARKGDSAAQYGLAMAYLQGKGTETDMPRALKWLRQAAQNGLAAAQEQLHKLEPPPAAPQNDNQTETDAPTEPAAPPQSQTPALPATPPTAEPAVTADHALNQVLSHSTPSPLSANTVASSTESKIGAAPGAALETLRASLRATPDPILELRLKHAEQSGEAMAACHMGVICEKARNWENARRWYAKAANQGLALGLYNLGVLWETGRGGERDWQQAFTCYQQAAQQGYVKAQYNLCLLYARGQGTGRNLEQAKKWCAEAAEQGLPEAKKLAEMFSKHAESAGSPETQTETTGA
ncbi:MAG: hypothetical protein Q4F00_01110 [bacterium]|nr:hypothetical protein [bacterium]